MSTKLFKNTEGKVLMSVGNKLIKQPYEFGLSFENRMGLNNYFEVSGINLPSNWSVLAIVNHPTGADTALISAISTSLNQADNYFIRGGVSGATLLNYIDNLGLTAIGSSSTNKSLRYAYSNQSYHSFFNDANKSIYVTPATRTEGLRDKLRICAGGYYTGNTIGASYNFVVGQKLSLIHIFNRELTLGELLYFRNNLLYNDLQSTDGLIHTYKFGFAENINSLPSIRDLVGDAHLEIKNLPAGTAQQKVDYANANLFVPFQ